MAVETSNTWALAAMLFSFGREWGRN